MKLFTKYQRINLIATITIFLIASVSFYFVLHFILIDQIDDDLKIEQNEIETYTKEHNRLPETVDIKDQVIHYSASSKPLKRYFETKPLNNVSGKENDFRFLYFSIYTGNTWYLVSVAKSLEDTDDLIHSIILITLTTILMILAAAFFINRFLLKKLWKPFYKTLLQVKDFKVSNGQNIKFEAVPIEEFAFMNQTLENLIHKASYDYAILKTFSENAAHELQTPVSVIRSKLDLLIQDEELTQQQSERLQSAYNAVQKLTRLNGSLLLLAKIENNQYDAISTINLKIKVEEKLRDFQELWQVQQLHIQPFLESVLVQMNNDLCDILLNNLLSNATLHNVNNGFIRIKLQATKMVITNSSDAESLSSEQLFSRFHHLAKRGQSNGLGLSIVKQICEVSHFEINYSCSQLQHTFTVSWK